MKKGFISFLIWFILPLFMFGQSARVKCNKVKSGTFYFYPAASQKEFIIKRKNSIQKEINVTTSDTTFWKINWKNNCVFELKFIRKNQPISDNEKSFYNSHITVFKILKITKDYYTFTGGLDSVSNTSALADTLWFKAKVN